MKISSNIIILGAKPIKGMRSLGAISNIPVCGKKSILDSQLQNLNRRFTCDNIIYVGGYLGDRIQQTQHRYPICYIDNPDYDIKNNGYSLKLASALLNKYDSTLILFSKVLFNYHIFDGLYKLKSSSVFIDKSVKNLYKVGCNISSDSNLINNLFYGLSNRLCGIYFLTGSEHESLLEMLATKNNIDNTFIFEIINSIIESGGKFLPSVVDHKLVHQIDSNYSLKKIIKHYAKNFST
jgi:choline kinase